MRRVYEIHLYDLIKFHGRVFAIDDVDLLPFPLSYESLDSIPLLAKDPIKNPIRLIIRCREVFAHSKIEDELEPKVMKLLEDLERYGKRLSKFKLGHVMGSYDVDLEMLQWINTAIESVNGNEGISKQT